MYYCVYLLWKWILVIIMIMMNNNIGRNVYCIISLHRWINNSGLCYTELCPQFFTTSWCSCCLLPLFLSIYSNIFLESLLKMWCLLIQGLNSKACVRWSIVCFHASLSYLYSLQFWRKFWFLYALGKCYGSTHILVIVSSTIIKTQLP